ncbi:MAG: acyl-CoA synthetase [Rhodocyclaceae bacterium]|nr:MAG: acyl-CoA synthetase [Rhodocyclaceae bacterium]
MQPTFAPIATLADILRIEEMPLSSQYVLRSTLDIFRQAALEYGERPALQFLLEGNTDEAPVTLDYAGLLARIYQTANALQALGMRAGEVVAYVLPNLPQTHYVIWGGEAAGIVAAVNPMLEAAQIADILNACNTKYLVTLAPFPGNDLWHKAEAYVPLVTSLQAILQVDLARYAEPEASPRSIRVGELGALPVYDFDTLIAAQPDDRLVSGRIIAPGDIASYFHTGGTTGLPKIAPHTHANEVFMAWAMMSVLNMRAGEVFLCGLPLFHVNGVMVTGLSNFLCGATVVVATPQGYRNPKLLPNFWKLIERYRVNYFSAVPTIYTALLDIPVGENDVSSLRYAICGAAPMPPEVFRRFEKLTGVKILEGYGLTEGTTASCMNPLAGERRIGSIGLRFPYQEMRTFVVGSDGKLEHQCATEEIGAVCIRGPNVFPGYLRAADNKNIWSAGDAHGNWLNTGDLGRIDADGYCWLTGRAKDLIIRGGHNIDPQLIEEVLCQHPAVAIAAAVGQPDSYAGEVPAAYVVLRAGQQASVEEIIQFARSHISERAAVPEHIEILPQLPVTAVGKIFKPALRHRAIEHVLGSALQEIGITATVSVSEDKLAGTLARIRAPAASRTQARELLDKFTVKTELIDHD